MAKCNSTGGADQLPAFILARNQQALAAGLSIEKQALSKGKLSTVYVGLPDQFIATGWVREPEKFLQSVNAPTKQPYACYAHISSPASVFPTFRRGQGKALRVTITRELMPLRVWEPHKGVMAYEFYNEHISGGVQHTYVAPRETLVNVGIVAAHVFEGYRHCDYEDGARRALLWHWDEDEALGLMTLSLYPENIEWFRHVEKAKKKSKYATADEWRESKLETLETCEAFLVADTACKNGLVFSFPDAVQGEIQRHLSEIEGLITHCPINSRRDPDLPVIAEVKRQFEASIAKRDKGFKTFMQRTTSATEKASRPT